MIDKTKIDLACGASKKEGYFGIDVAAIEGVDLVHDLTIYPWPLEDNSVELLNCTHYIEHIPHQEWGALLKESNSFEEFKEKALYDTRDGVIKFIDEIYRIMKKKGKVTISAPYVSSMRSYGDPTHTRYMHDMSFYYFNKDWRDQNKLSHYGIKSDFEVTFSYFVTNELSLKSDTVRMDAFNRDWNSIDDLIIEMIKK